MQCFTARDGASDSTPRTGTGPDSHCLHPAEEASEAMYCSSPLLLNVRGAHIRADRKAGLPSPVPWGGSSCGVWAKCLHAALGASGEGFAVEGVSGVGSLRGHVALQPKLSLEPGSVTYQLCGRGRGPYLCELISTERECRFIPSFKEIHGARAMGLALGWTALGQW